MASCIYIVPHGNYIPFIHVQNDKEKSRRYLEIPNDKWVIKKKNLVHDKIIYKMKKEMTSKGLVEYSFSHFNLKAQVFFLEIKKDIFPNQRWIKTNKISYSGLPTVMKKIIKVAL